ncbi:MAG TPA: pyridoxamine 5'-phosphate oxidase [Bacteroidales bacterium]|nr:pyridoxamine 5'-phosphate oxidase [Bacteroidales bacterium]HRZ48743.1 pyridoxamine 5'-phosphate oxidase [Bacteroidales bacterium]
MKPGISNLRQAYQLGSLERPQLLQDPVLQFEYWFSHALDAGIQEPNAMVLSTSNSAGSPSSRVVLLKDFSNEGFTFFTNYHSRKGEEIAINPKVALLFLWLPLERQVRIEGQAVRLPDADSESYFRSRPEGSRLGAWASEQSRVIAGRETLEERLQYFRTTWAGNEIPRPPHWGGYRVIPSYFEFWQGRDNRLHDRFSYTPEGTHWRIDRLAP